MYQGFKIGRGVCFLGICRHDIRITVKCDHWIRKARHEVSQIESGQTKLEDSDLANILIIALSANAFEEDRKASTDAGMNGHLAKPVNVSELLKMLCKLL